MCLASNEFTTHFRELNESTCLNIDSIMYAWFFSPLVLKEWHRRESEPSLKPFLNKIDHVHVLLLSENKG